MKNDLSNFAVLDGPPLFSEPLIVGRPNMPDRSELLRRIELVLNSGWLSNDGPMVKEFERQVAQRLNVKHVVAVCNGTVALQVMAKACGLTGEVIVPSMTFIATPHAVQWIGLTPVFADVASCDHTLDPDTVELCISPQTSAILGVHLWGNPCHVEQLHRIAIRHGLKLLFDASHAFGCEYDGQPIGNFGLAEAFSFHATKVMHAAEGGAIATNDDGIAEQCRLLRNFGISDFTRIDSTGTNAKMSELCAATGLTSLDTIDTVLEHNKANMNTYREVLNGIPGLHLAIRPASAQRNYQYVVVCVDECEFGLSRDDLLVVLRAEGVMARSYFSPGCHNAEPYAGLPIHHPVPMPVTEGLLKDVLQLPTGPTITQSDIERIGQLLGAVYQQATTLRSCLVDRTPSSSIPDAA